MRISGFKKSYSGRTVLEVPETELERDRIYCIIGANGSGKSSFARILAGIIKPDSGKAPLEMKLSVGYMPQKSYAYRMSLKGNLLLGCRDEKRAETLMSALKLSGLSSQRADRLSGGETARMAMARLMMKKFDMLILDEPTASMDMEGTLSAERQIRSYRRETGCCLILITHSLQQAKRLADEILFFKDGKIWERGQAEELLTAAKAPETKEFLEFYGI